VSTTFVSEFSRVAALPKCRPIQNTRAH